MDFITLSLLLLRFFPFNAIVQDFVYDIWEFLLFVSLFQFCACRFGELFHRSSSSNNNHYRADNFVPFISSLLCTFFKKKRYLYDEERLFGKRTRNVNCAWVSFHGHSLIFIQILNLWVGILWLCVIHTPHSLTHTLQQIPIFVV